MYLASCFNLYNVLANSLDFVADFCFCISVKLDFSTYIQFFQLIVYKLKPDFNLMILFPVDASHCRYDKTVTLYFRKKDRCRRCIIRPDENTPPEFLWAKTKKNIQNVFLFGS